MVYSARLYALVIFVSLPLVAAPPAPTTPITVPGLEASAEILVDQWGVPHIYASRHYDAFVAQGFNAARDRLWQIDLWRRRGLGRLAEVLGPRFLDQDRASRLFLYRGDMQAEWLAYGDDAKRIAQAFVAGVNAYIDYVEANPELLPPEFEVLGYQPTKWSADDVVRIRSHGLWRNVSNEVARAQLTCLAGADRAAVWKVLEPTWTTTTPSGFDPCSLPTGVLDVYDLAKAPVLFDVRKSARTNSLAEIESLGSNNWAVAPARSATSGAVIANDPHRAHTVPSLRYISHLVAPGLNVIGAGEPALPGISIGHNEHIAFGLTVFGIDHEDLYVYEQDPDNRDAYRYGGRFEPLRILEATIRVKGAEPVSVALAFTRHGPVVRQVDGKLYAVRAAWLEPGMAPYFGSIAYIRARNSREFLAALNRWGGPSENQVYADVDGDVGLKPVGRFPRRTKHDGLLPVPGDGRFEWDGFFDMDALPLEVNPVRGFVSSANAINLPPNYPIDEQRIGFEWSSPWRHRRINRELASEEAHTLDHSLALQRDYRSLLALRLVEALSRDLQSTEAGRILVDWDGSMTADSSAAALFSIWYHRHLMPRLTEWSLGQQDVVKSIDSLSVVRLVEWGTLDDLVAASMVDAYQETQETFGTDTANWRWGDLHEIAFEHPLIGLAPPELARSMRLPRFPRGGSSNTTNNGGFSPENFIVRSGASFRFVADTSDWDAARMTNAPGQSGDPRSPFYDNLLEGWAKDDSFPLLFSREAVENHTVSVIRLVPAADQPPTEVRVHPQNDVPKTPTRAIR